MKNLFKRFISISIILLISSHAYAKSNNKTWKPIITLGGGTATNSRGFGDSNNFPIQDVTSDQYYNYAGTKRTQTSALMEGFVGLELPICSRWFMQIGLDYDQQSPFSAKGTFVQGADSESQDSYTYGYGVLARQLLVEAKFLYTYKKYFHPYGLLGMGASFNKAYNYYTNVPVDLTFTRMYADNTTSSFSYAVGLGVDVDIFTHIRAGIGYRFADLGKAKLGSAMIDTTAVSGTLTQSHIYANIFLAQITWVI